MSLTTTLLVSKLRSTFDISLVASYIVGQSIQIQADLDENKKKVWDFQKFAKLISLDQVNNFLAIIKGVTALFV